MNQVTLTGRLTADPTTRTTSDGVSVTQFNLAVSNGTKDEYGNYLTDFYRCSAWRYWSQRAEKLVKGQPVLVTGNISLSNFKKRDGSDGYSLEVLVNSLENLSFAQKAKTNDLMDGLD